MENLNAQLNHYVTTWGCFLLFTAAGFVFPWCWGISALWLVARWPKLLFFLPFGIFTALKYGIY